MIDLSKRTRLGLYVMVELARTPDAQRSSEELAEVLDVSGNHLAKVLQTLARRGWILGTRGAGGGYRLSADPKRTSMADVVEVFDGPPNTAECALMGHEVCSREVDCSIKSVVQEIETQAIYTLASVTIEMLANPGRREAAANA